MMNHFKPNYKGGTKPCPICGKTISANKELCFACFTEHGSLAAYEAKQTPAVAEKKPRKPRAKKETTADAAPKTPRKRTQKVVVA